MSLVVAADAVVVAIGFDEAVEGANAAVCGAANLLDGIDATGGGSEALGCGFHLQEALQRLMGLLLKERLRRNPKDDALLHSTPQSIEIFRIAHQLRTEQADCLSNSINRFRQNEEKWSTLGGIGVVGE